MKFICVFGKAVECKNWPRCEADEIEVDPADCPQLSYILREAEECERLMLVRLERWRTRSEGLRCRNAVLVHPPLKHKGHLY
jgi:hypothetical protein